MKVLKTNDIWYGMTYKEDVGAVTLTINTGKVNKEGEINYKTYMGYAAITAYGTALSCNMYSDELDEFCFLMFRLFKINFGAQDFRIAEVACL